jgi:ABC-type branched-subunit amino acid transport system permease subunit
MVQWDLPLLVGIAFGLIASLLLALVLGVPTLRLRADYLAIVTIAAAEILRLVFGAVETKEVFGGSNGLNGFTDTWNSLNPYTGGLDIGIASWGRNDLWAMTVGWATVALCCLLVWALMRSPWGRVLRSIREDEDAVRSLGKNVFLYKMQALIIGGIFGSLAGIIFTLPTGAVQPANYGTELTFFLWTALLIGGMATVFGSIVGSMIFWVVLSLTQGILLGLIQADVITFLTAAQAGQLRYILVGVALMSLMIFRPQGILGNKKELAFA